MGNRAVITTAPYDENHLGIYVHWNGGHESIEGFLRAARQLGYRDPTGDRAYGMARLTAAIATFFGGESSVGIDVCKYLDTDNGDNGTWLIGPGWTLMGTTDEPILPFLSSTQNAKADAICAEIVAKVEAAANAKVGQ